MTIPPNGSAAPVFDRSAVEAAPAPDRSIDQRSLRTMMGAAAYHARRVARTMRLSEADRENVEQDILLVLLERRRFFDPARGAWSSFADRIARQAAQGVADEIGAEFRMWGGSLDLAAGTGRTTTLGELIGAEQWTGPDVERELQLPLVLADFIAELPDELALVARVSLLEDGDLPAAQRRSSLSTSEFYRRLREIRYRMFTLELVDRRSVLGLLTSWEDRQPRSLPKEYRGNVARTARARTQEDPHALKSNPIRRIRSPRPPGKI